MGKTSIVEIEFSLEDLSLEELNEIYAEMSDEDKHYFESLLRNSPPRSLMPHQMVPLDLEWWEVSLHVGGRGTGKTVTGATEARNHLRRLGKAARVGVAAPTNSDARDTCMEGDTGLITMFPNEFKYYNRSLGEARHIDGGFVKAMGTEKPGRWNGPQWSMLWFDELALCNQAAWDDANLGLRLGPRPYAVATTTPKNRKWVKKLALDKTTYVPQYNVYNDDGELVIGSDGKPKLRLPTTFDNLFLPKRRVDWLKNKYGGSRLGRQELDGMFIDDIDGAMWKRSMIHHVTDPDDWPRFIRTVVAIDPAGSRARQTADKNSLSEEDRQNQRKNADTAITVVAQGIDNKYYVLACEAGQWSPIEWGAKAIEMFHKYRADKIIAERNFGGEMVEATLRNVNQWSPLLNRHLRGRSLPISTVIASKGKDIRAQPVVTLYEQSRVIHCLMFAGLEDQMCAFIDADDNEGADMVDSLVWAIVDLGGLGFSDQRPVLGAVNSTMRAFVVK